PKIAITWSRLPAFTASVSASTASSGEANVRAAAGAPAASGITAMTAAPTIPAIPATIATTVRRDDVRRCMTAILTASQRRGPPPPPPPRERELLRLCVPRLLAARSDFPLEYPENASDFVPLRSAVDERCAAGSPLLWPRDS